MYDIFIYGIVYPYITTACETAVRLHFASQVKGNSPSFTKVDFQAFGLLELFNHSLWEISHSTPILTVYSFRPGGQYSSAHRSDTL